MKCEENPWNIDSIYKLQYFICPSCIFKDHSKQEIINHACENHPDSIEFLNNIKDNSLVDIICPWNDYEIKKANDFKDILSLTNVRSLVDNNIKQDPLEIKTNEIDEYSDVENAEFISNIEAPKEHFHKQKFEPKIETLVNTSDDINLNSYDNIFDIEPNYVENENAVEGCRHKSGRCNCIVKRLHKCDHCEKSFSRSQHLTTHVKTVHNIKVDRKCEYCEKSFARLSQLVTHVKDVHKDRLICKYENCGKSFMTINYLKSHVKTVHEGRKDHHCETCGKSFANLGNLKYHVQTVHEGKKDHECNECGKLFSKLGDLKKHISAVHEGQKTEECDLCGKVFSRQENLKVHIKNVHEGQRNYGCEQCGKFFSQEGGLRTHIKTVHEGQKDHVCSKCGKSFGEKNRLQAHIKNVHEGLRNLYNCDLCGKSFVNSHYIKIHIQTVHEGRRNYACIHCEKSFRDKYFS